MSDVINISAYAFTPLRDLAPLKDMLSALSREQGLRGTILLSTEGINLFVAGSREGVDTLVAALRAVPGLADLTPKESRSREQPYNRMLVKIKKEIIAFGVAGIDPAQHPTPRLPAAELKHWLDEGRPVTLIDTRNNYELKLGTFRGAVPAGIDHFREFPDAVKRLPEELKTQPVVVFCTGGIRCEKAGPYLQQAGFQQVHQLEGGILKYFEECGGAHFEGECFVFDRRVGVDSRLQETDTCMCFRCQMPLNADDQRHPLYVPDEACPYCAPTIRADPSD